MIAVEKLMEENDTPCRLARTVPELLARVPLYQRTGYPRAEESSAGDCSLEVFHNLPFITKSDLRLGFPENFLGAGQNLDSLVEAGLVEVEHTSGTSAERTPLLLRKGWWLEQEELALRLNPFIASVLDENPLARRITINSPTCNNDICYTTVPNRDERIVGEALSLSLSRHPFLWSVEDLDRMVEETLEWNPVFLDVDPVYGVVFALHCEKRGIKLPKLRFIICSYEYVSTVHRRILARVFSVPVVALYGATETGHLLMEDQEARFTPSLETAHLEIVQCDSRGIGKLVATTFTNEYMPLLRYQLGDLAEESHQGGQISYLIHGREKDSLHLADGSRVTTQEVDNCFQDVLGIAHYQILQRTPKDYLLRYVSEIQPPSASALALLGNRLSTLLKISTPVEIMQADLILPEGSGKFRLLAPAKKAVGP